MSEPAKTEKISVMLPPPTLARLDQYAAQHRWSRSTAALSLIEQGLGHQEGDDSDRAH